MGGARKKRLRPSGDGLNIHLINGSVSYCQAFLTLSSHPAPPLPVPLIAGIGSRTTRKPLRHTPELSPLAK
jgi:hypothetical protein